MTNYSVDTVDKYISEAPEKARSHLKQIRAAIKAAVPNAEEQVRWGKPYYRFHGMLAGFDALKNHVSFEIWADELQAEHRDQLEERGYKTGKRTFQIAYEQDVPAAVIETLAKVKAKANQNKK